MDQDHTKSNEYSLAHTVTESFVIGSKYQQCPEVMRLKITEAGEHERTEVQKHEHAERHGDEGTKESIFSKND